VLYFVLGDGLRGIKEAHMSTNAMVLVHFTTFC